MRTRSSYRGTIREVGNIVHKVSDASTRRCIREAEKKYASALKEYPDKAHGFCKYDRYYAFSAAFSSLVYYQVFALAVMPGFRVGLKVAQYTKLVLRPIYFMAAKVAGLCSDAAQGVLMDNKGYFETLTVSAQATGCTAIVLAISMALETHVGKAVASILKAVGKSAAMSFSSIRALLNSDLWDTLRPVYIAHILRQSLKKKDVVAVFNGPPVTLPVDISQGAHALGPPPTPLLITYKPPPKEPKALRRSTRIK